MESLMKLDSFIKVTVTYNNHKYIYDLNMLIKLIVNNKELIIGILLMIFLPMTYIYIILSICLAFLYFNKKSFTLTIDVNKPSENTPNKLNKPNKPKPLNPQYLQPVMRFIQTPYERVPTALPPSNTGYIDANDE